MKAKFWRRRPDRIAINQQGRILYLIEFKRTMDIGVDFAEQAELRANNQYENLRSALEEVGRGDRWQIKQINIIGGTLGSVHVEAFEEMLKVMEVNNRERTCCRPYNQKSAVGAGWCKETRPHT